MVTTKCIAGEESRTFSSDYMLHTRYTRHLYYFVAAGDSVFLLKIVQLDSLETPIIVFDRRTEKPRDARQGITLVPSYVIELAAQYFETTDIS